MRASRTESNQLFGGACVGDKSFCRLFFTGQTFTPKNENKKQQITVDVTAAWRLRRPAFRSNILSFYRFHRH